MSDIYTPAGNLLHSLHLIPLPDSAIPLEAIVLVKALDEEGQACWFTRYTENLSMMEAIGVLSVTHQTCLEGAIDGYVAEIEFEDDDDDDEDEGY